MNKKVMILLVLMLCASPVTARATGTALPELPTVEAQPMESPGVVLNTKLGLGYRFITHNGDPAHAGEYEYLRSSGVGSLDFEWDTLPHRFRLESYYLNAKDYFGELDYAYKDIVLFNMYTRGLYHNLDHFTFGPDDMTTPSPSFTDRNPHDVYAIESQTQRAFIRFKTPDFPFHLFADVQTLDRDGLVQQRFLRGYTGGLDKVSQSRNVDWKTQNVRLGMNSHLGPVEAEYSHEEKKFQVNSDKVLLDYYPTFVPAMTIPHNEVPELKSSQDTVKLHTSYSGGFVAAATFSNGDKKNQDSGAKVDFRNAAADITFIPVTSVTLFVKYRHYDLDTSNPGTVPMPGLVPGPATYAVRDSLSSTRDQMSGIIRYRVNARLTVKGEYLFETINRGPSSGSTLSPLQITPPPPSGSVPNYWNVAHRTTKSTERLGITYRVMNKLSLRADYSATQVTDPAYANDPDRVNSGTATITWTPVQRIIALASYGGVREKRSDLSAPLGGGSRKSDRDQALGSLTFLVGKSASITASYLYFRNKSAQTITFRDGTGAFILEDGVPYGDKAQVFSLSAGVALGEGVMLTADGSKCYTEGNFRVSGTVPNTAGIDVLSDMKVVEDIYGASVVVQHSKHLGSELRFQQRQYDDQIDNTQDGKVSTILAFVSMKW
jgi:hypothetical protein